MRQAADAAGKLPHWFPGPNLEEPSRRMEALKRYLSPMLYPRRPKNEINFELSTNNPGIGGFTDWGIPPSVRRFVVILVSAIFGKRPRDCPYEYPPVKSIAPGPIKVCGW